ncbi:hypothetical protein GCM10009731_23450 [Streptomyces globosus]|jgi:hypothetical protein
MLSMADTTPADAADKKQERAAAKLAKQIGAFAKEHGGAEGHLAHIGQAGTRIVLVGADGAWGDLVAPTHAAAALAAQKAALTLHEDFDGDFAARVKTGPYEWNRMAGLQLGGTQPAA